MRNSLFLFTVCLFLVLGGGQLSGQAKHSAPDAEGNPPAQSPSCKPVTRWDVKGCERLADGSCPKDYVQKTACPSNPMIKAPCYLMCVPAPKDSTDKAKPEA